MAVLARKETAEIVIIEFTKKYEKISKSVDFESGIIKRTERGAPDMKTIITVGRQFGSGGHEIGRRLAEQLQIPCYDKELIKDAAAIYTACGAEKELIALFYLFMVCSIYIFLSI